MTKFLVGTAVLASALVASGQAPARAPAPLIPTAIVEDVKSASAEIEFMDYVGTGQVIKLEPGDVLVLSYLRSCEHETITGGTVRVGSSKSDVEGGTVTRAKVPCNGGNMKLTSAQANTSGASSFRLQSAALESTLYALPPVFEIPKLRTNESRTLTIEGTTKRTERITVELEPSLANGGFYDLARQSARLRPGARYTATLGDRKVIFTVDAKAKPGKASVVSRLLRFPPG
jgi:hypothetical protein